MYIKARALRLGVCRISALSYQSSLEYTAYGISIRPTDLQFREWINYIYWI